jgi:DNA invertase Pin-like site-specific DNA recombinase
MAIKIVESARMPEYDLRGIQLDLTRKTGVLIRQSKKGADLESRESRLRQESLVPVAAALRGDTDRSNIILYDEGSGVSGTKGYDERPELSRLYMDIANGVIGSIVVARADRLFRDKHFRNVSMFTELAERKGIKVIVPGRTVYDFTKTKDLQAFQREMQEAYSYIATQVAYMQDTRRQKIQRGFYGGGNLPAPYAIERAAEKDVQLPVIYRPWQGIVLDLFEKFRAFDFRLARIARYIEEQPFLFPYPTAEDLQRYMFKTRMRTVTGGYTFSGADSISKYFSNLALGGFAKIGKDSDGNMLLLANAFEAAVPMELLSPSFAAITGRFPDGSPFERKHKFVHSKSISWEDSPAILRGLLQSDDGAVSYHSNWHKGVPWYTCNKGMSVDGWTLRNKVGIMRQLTAWSVACEDLDDIVIKRLCALALFDGDISDRIKAFWDRRKSDQVNEAQVVTTQIEKAEAQIRRLDKLLTDPAVPLSAETERRYIELLHEAEQDMQRLLKKRAEFGQYDDPEKVIADFYYVLAHLPTAYKSLTPANQKRMAQQVIRDIRLNSISPHLFLLPIEWQNGIASCPDLALVWRGITPNNSEAWTPEEDAILQELYPSAPQVEIMQALPSRAWDRILERAQVFSFRRKIKHAGPHPFNVYHRTMTWRDLEAVSALVDNPEQQDRLRQVANDLAKKTMRGGLSAHWWLPLEAINYGANTQAPDDEDYQSLLYVSALACGWPRRGGSYRR